MKILRRHWDWISACHHLCTYRRSLTELPTLIWY